MTFGLRRLFTLIRLGRPAAAAARGQSVVEFALLAPIMVFLLFAIFDLARVYTAMASVESAAREAADYATSAQGAIAWSDANIDATVAEMKRRACVAASDLPDFEWSDADSDGVVDTGEECSNPGFAACVRQTSGTACNDVATLDTTDPGYTCHDTSRNPPCRVTVTMSHVFHLFVPFQLDFFGVQLGLPVTLSFERDSTFAMTDIDVTTTPPPGP
jgi:hypothetical protein